MALKISEQHAVLIIYSDSVIQQGFVCVEIEREVFSFTLKKQ